MRPLILLVCVIFHVYGEELDSSEYGVISTEISPNCSCGWSNKEDKQTESGMNGRGAGKFKYPMMAGIIDMKDNSVICGGTIITNRHIITSADCTTNVGPKNSWILVGTNNYEPTTKIFYKIGKVIQHPDYVSSTQRHHLISIIISKTQFELGRTLGPSCLPTKSIDLTTEKLITLGWRNLRFKGLDNAVVLETYAKSRLIEECTLDYNTETEKQLCIYTRNTFTCQEEGAGGPLLWLNPATNRYTVVGVQSDGVHCQRFSTATSIMYFLPWIQKEISETGPSTLTCSAPE